MPENRKTAGHALSSLAVIRFSMNVSSFQNKKPSLHIGTELDQFVKWELIYRRDMLCYERDSLGLDDLIQELNEEIEELREKLRNIA